MKLSSGQWFVVVMTTVVAVLAWVAVFLAPRFSLAGRLASLAAILATWALIVGASLWSE